LVASLTTLLHSSLLFSHRWTWSSIRAITLSIKRENNPVHNILSHTKITSQWYKEFRTESMACRVILRVFSHKGHRGQRAH